MKTFNRNPANVDTSGIRNYSKYFNQMNFKGISEDDNIYAIDQETFRDANNVYVNSDNKLVSRPTLQKDSLPSEINVYQYDLEDVKYIGQNTIYINKSKTGSGYYFILLVDKNNNKYSLENITDYHISTIEHYIICWNNIGARVFDTSEPNKGWQDFNDFVEIPITKVITNTSETEFPKNEFSSQYKESYTYASSSPVVLPQNELLDADAEILTNGQKIEYRIDNANQFTDYKLAKTIEVQNGKISVVYNKTTKRRMVAIAKDSIFYLSLDGGNTYSKLLYPDFTGNYLGGALSDDGLYFCLVTTSGIYFCNLDDYSWSSEKDITDIGDIETLITDEGKHDRLFATEIIDMRFLTKDIYAILTDNKGPNEIHTMRPKVILYCKGPGLFAGDDYTKAGKLCAIYSFNEGTGNGVSKLFEDFINGDHMSPVVLHKVNSRDRMKLFLVKNNKDEDITIITFVGQVRTTQDALGIIIGGKNMKYAADNPERYPKMPIFGMYTSLGMKGTITGGEVLEPTGEDWVYGFKVKGYVGFEVESSETAFKEFSWSEYGYKFLIKTVATNETDYVGKSSISTWTKQLPKHQYQFDDYIDVTGTETLILPTRVAQGLLYRPVGGTLWFLPDDSDVWIELDYIAKLSTGRYGWEAGMQTILVAEDKYFIYCAPNNLDRLIITNNFETSSDEEAAIISLIYTFGTKTNFTKIPKVSYSDTELYLAFGDLLQITSNTKSKDDVTKINFNLSSLNNQSFIDEITAMVNISTTEVALFFLNKIVICSKVQDTNLAQGYRYDYYNTKFSIGVRLGDTVMNTLEGQYTIFPTKRGLAVMNYQAFMATTDQVVEYITDNIRELWNNFYESNNVIKIIQYNNKLIFTNGTNIILLYDLDRTAWWKWEVPIVIKSAVTDQLDLRLIDTNLNIFKDATQYYDFGEIGNFKEINWFLMSQPLHMNAPNYYKNMKQLVFQFAEADDNIVTKTMNAQIKLYRKRLSIKEPETIKFQIENLRTFVKRFNYWKINEIQWALGNDTDTNVPKQFELNAVGIKYEIGDEVR